MTDEEKKKEKEYLKQESQKARKEEWDKIKSLGTGARIQYLWDYYKFVLVIVFFAVMAVYIISNMVIGARTKVLLYTCIMNVDELDTYDEVLQEDFIQSIGGIGKREKVDFDTSIRINPDSNGTSQLDVANTVKMTAFLQSGTLDVCIAPIEVTQFMQEQGILLALDDLLDKDLKAEYQAGGYLYFAPEPLYDEKTGAVILPETEEDDAGRYAEQTEASDSMAGTPADVSADVPVKDREEHIYAVRVDQSGVLARYGIHIGNEVWFSVVGNSQNTDMAMKLFDFLQG